MKKTYITPVALQVSLETSLPLALSGYNEVGDGNQLVKGFVDDFDEEENTIGLTNIWDEEW